LADDPADEAARGAGVRHDLGRDRGEGAHRVAEGLVLADQPGQVEAHLDRHVRRAGEMERHVVRYPPPQLAVQREVEGGDHTDTALRARAAEKGDVHVSTGLTLGDEHTTDRENARVDDGRGGVRAWSIRACQTLANRYRKPGLTGETTAHDHPHAARAGR